METRCFLAKGLNTKYNVVIGIATEVKNIRGQSFDICYYEQEGWTVEDQKKFDYLQGLTGFYTNTTKTEFQTDEYPNPDEMDEIDE